ncbi:hypothetical protein Droror1_Dr00019526 [Drosera rotundifolia]
MTVSSILELVREAPRNPREAEAKLALLRHDYTKQRKEIRLEREERRKAKAAAFDRKAFEEDFRRKLLKKKGEQWSREKKKR